VVDTATTQRPNQMTRAQAKEVALFWVRRWRKLSRPWNAGEPLDIGETWEDVFNERGEVAARIVLRAASGWRDD
jgi:hypothetical protein